MLEHINHIERRHNQQKIYNMNLHHQQSSPRKNTTFQPLHVRIYSILLHISVNHGDRLQAATKCRHKAKMLYRKPPLYSRSIKMH